MSYFEFPHTRNYDGDLGFVIKKIIELTEKYNDFFAYNSIKFADPLQWDITKQYEAYTIVFDYASEYSYISKRPVPVGINITNSDYWVLVGPLIIDAQARASIDNILRFIANHFEASNIATVVHQVGEYLVSNGKLYKVTALINIGEGITEGYNVTATTVENMISDQFPIWSDKIANGAVTTSKIADGAITQPKLGQHIVYKENIASNKYIFIGDSFNADYHHSWGEKMIAKMGLTLNTNVWNVAVPGGGIANGYILSGLQEQTASMTSAQRNTVTKILMCFGANDWGRTADEIRPGAVNLENYLVGTFPNAEIIFVAAQWGYLNDTYRQGLLNAYNTYISSWYRIKTIDKAFLMMMDPYFVEPDMVHPTDNCNTNLASLFINILNGGSAWTRYYSNLSATIDTTAFGGDQSSFFIYGDITEAGTHLWRNDTTPIVFSTPIQIEHNSMTQIGTIQAVANNFFQRKAEFPCEVFCLYKMPDNSDAFGVFKGRFVIQKHSDSDAYWDVYLLSDSFLNNSYVIKATRLYITFNTLLDYTRT